MIKFAFANTKALSNKDQFANYTIAAGLEAIVLAANSSFVYYEKYHPNIFLEVIFIYVRFFPHIFFLVYKF